MSNFKEFKKLFQKNFETISKNKTLFQVEIPDKEEFWNLYLNSFPEGTNPMFRTKTEYDCSCCRHFVKSFGAVVVIEDNKIETIWNFDAKSTTFQPVIDALDSYIKSKIVSDVYVTKENKIGVEMNRERDEVTGKITEWNHFAITLPNVFVNKSSSTIGEVQNDFRTTKSVFKRSLDEISLDSIETVLELITSNTLYKGEEWKPVLTEFLKLKKDYMKLTTDSEKDNFTWETSVRVGAVIGRIRNHSIGTLLVNISEDMDLDEAVRKYEAIVAPSNYKRPKALFTAKMLEEAKKTLEKEGLLDSLGRRYANIHDITINNILFSNKDVVMKTSNGGLFEEMKTDVVVNSAKKFSKVEEVTIDNFLNNILPSANSVEVFLENKLSKNFVSLIAPENNESKTMFKWDNRFSWAYTGNITDSDIRQNVKKAGGSVTGVLRFSIQWNDVEQDRNDLDAHCIEPDKNEISFRNRNRHKSTGELDVDIIYPNVNEPAVENITWSDKNMMKKGTYGFFVNCFSNNGGRSGFRAEIEFDGQVYNFDYNREMRRGENVGVATIVFDGVNFAITEQLPSTSSSREVWNLKTNQFVPVSVIMNSPNYWDLQEGIGNRHFFFMLKGCVNSENPNGFYNEFLKEDLMKHKKVMEAVGAKMKVNETIEQLSGVGFSSTMRNDVTVKVRSNNTDRVMKIKF